MQSIRFGDNQMRHRWQRKTTRQHFDSTLPSRSRCTSWGRTYCGIKGIIGATVGGVLIYYAVNSIWRQPNATQVAAKDHETAFRLYFAIQIEMHLLGTNLLRNKGYNWGHSWWCTDLLCSQFDLETTKCDTGGSERPRDSISTLLCHPDRDAPLGDEPTAE